ncbi:MAG: hypothetical protein PVI91_00410 [Gammaproteobacteria bacterium]|jgi:hypothetical protein
MELVRSRVVLCGLVAVAALVRVGTCTAQGPGPAERSKQPGMAVFYRLNAAGELVPENPVRSGFALDATATYDAPQPPDRPAPPALVIVAPPDPGRARLRIEIPRTAAKRSFHSELEAFRCERHGFFFSTSAGRCVAPALGPPFERGPQSWPRLRSAPTAAPSK